MTYAQLFGSAAMNAFASYSCPDLLQISRVIMYNNKTVDWNDSEPVGRRPQKEALRRFAPHNRKRKWNDLFSEGSFTFPSSAECA